MNGRGVSRSALLALLGLCLLAGLFMMHGVTATPSPVHVAEPMLASSSVQGMPSGDDAAHAMSGAHVPAAKQRGTKQRGTKQGGMNHGGMGADLGGCLAGAVCFALLAAAVLLAARTGRALVLPLPTGSAPGRVRRRGPPPTPPPSVYRLSVLRL